MYNLLLYNHLLYGNTQDCCLKFCGYLEEGSENWCVDEAFREQQRQEAEHGQAPVPALGSGRERPEAPSICRLAVQHGHDGRVGDQWHQRHIEHQTGPLGVQLIVHCQTAHLLGDGCPYDPEHRLQLFHPSKV